MTNKEKRMQMGLILLGIVGTVALGVAGFLVSNNLRTPAIWTLFVALILYALLFCLYLQDHGSRTDAESQKASGSPVEPPQASPKVESDAARPSASEAAQPRVFVNVKPEYLMGLYVENTSVQADKLAEAFLGKWIKVTGKVGNVADKNSVFPAQVLMRYGKNDWDIFEAFFSDEQQVDRIRMLRRGDKITVLGKLSQINQSGLRLQDCELMDE